MICRVGERDGEALLFFDFHFHFGFQYVALGLVTKGLCVDQIGPTLTAAIKLRFYDSLEAGAVSGTQVWKDQVPACNRCGDITLANLNVLCLQETISFFR